MIKLLKDILLFALFIFPFILGSGSPGMGVQYPGEQSNSLRGKSKCRSPSAINYPTPCSIIEHKPRVELNQRQQKGTGKRPKPNLSNGKDGGRVWIACDRCKTKKIKCSGPIPCESCIQNDWLCTAQSRRTTKNSKDGSHPQRYVEILENHSDILLDTVWKLYSFTREGRMWNLDRGQECLGRTVDEELSKPSLHHLAESLGTLNVWDLGDTEVGTAKLAEQFENAARFIREKGVKMEDGGPGSRRPPNSPTEHHNWKHVEQPGRCSDPKLMERRNPHSPYTTRAIKSESLDCTPNEPSFEIFGQAHKLHGLSTAICSESLDPSLGEHAFERFGQADWQYAPNPSVFSGSSTSRIENYIPGNFGIGVWGGFQPAVDPAFSTDAYGIPERNNLDSNALNSWKPYLVPQSKVPKADFGNGCFPGHMMDGNDIMEGTSLVCGSYGYDFPSYNGNHIWDGAFPGWCG